MNGALFKYQNGPGIDNKLKQTKGTAPKYFLQDHLGSTVALTDSTGAVTETNSYDSFGNPTNSAFSSRYQYTGREFDATMGLQYSRARWYDPNIGRFISEDPIGFAGGDVNLYGYVRNQPQIFRDPRGLFPGEDVLSDPNVLRNAAAAAGAVTSAGFIPSVAIGVGGAATGVAIGYPIGVYTANHPWNPFVQGPWPLNPYKPPFGYPDFFYPPITQTVRPGTRCEPMPRPIPFDYAPTSPWPTDDREGCAQEWADAYEWCAENMGKPDQRGGTGGHTSLRACAAGRVSKRCGGNAIDWGR